MPVKNIIPGQKVTKEKLQRAKEFRRDMTSAEQILWQELRANKLAVHFSRHTAPAGGAGGRSLLVLLLISIVIRLVWLLKSTETFMTCSKMRMPGAKWFCASWD